jgi:ABC-2 type transport system ATP-binding protein/lipopolysaccharide transport system ATP-binding protein
MAHLHLHDVSLSYPLYDVQARSLRNTLAAIGTGGRIRNESRRKTTVCALDKLDLRFEHGDRVVLVGHNGAGKTTLLRVLAGIYEPTSGHICVEGTVAALFDPMLGVDPEASGYENVLLRGTILGIPRAVMRERMDEIADFAGLGEYMSLPVRTYSSGMQLRLGFAISTSVQPDILLLDEWLGAGDQYFVEKAVNRMNRLVGSVGVLVLATHNLELAAQIGTRAVLLAHGRVVAQGSVQRVSEAYRSKGGGDRG